MSLPRSRALSFGFAALGLVTLAGCAVESAGATTSSGSGGTTYTDGTYTASASYQAPSGTESITVDLTIADGVVTAVDVSSDSSDHEAAQFQARFESGIASEVVGKDLSSLNVSRVSGSSLTSNGFNAAVEQIRSQAA